MVKIVRLQDDTWNSLVNMKRGMDTFDDVVRRALKLDKLKA